MFAVINSDNNFTGTVYSEVKDVIIKHHEQYGERLVKIQRKLTKDADGKVVELPTEEELKNEITKAPESMSEIQQRLEATENMILQLLLEEMN